MNRIQGIAVLSLFTVAAWGQAPAPSTPAAGGAAQSSSTPAATAPASAASTTASTAISGCLTQSFGVFTISDPATSKTVAIKPAGNDLWKVQNHVVKVQGLNDPKSASPVLYAQKVEDTGSACGNGTAAASNNPAGTAAPGTGAAQPAGPTAASTTGAAQPAGQPAASAQATPGAQSSQPGGGVSQNSAAAPQPATSQPAATPSSAAPTTPQGNTGAAAPVATPNAAEPKGTPEAGSPQGATTSNAALPQSDQTNAVFTGCLTGTVNNYQFKANGKAYRLQGNTTSLPQMLNHQVELTGEDFNGKAIQVNGARDLGGSCKGK